jgi:hypothetical protein
LSQGRPKDVAHQVGKGRVPCWKVDLQEFDRKADPARTKNYNYRGWNALWHLFTSQPCGENETKGDEPKNIDDDILDERPVKPESFPGRYEDYSLECMEHFRDDEIVTRISIVLGNGVLSIGK